MDMEQFGQEPCAVGGVLQQTRLWAVRTPRLLMPHCCVPAGCSMGRAGLGLDSTAAAEVVYVSLAVFSVLAWALATFPFSQPSCIWVSSQLTSDCSHLSLQ